MEDTELASSGIGEASSTLTDSELRVEFAVDHVAPGDYQCTLGTANNPNALLNAVADTYGRLGIVFFSFFLFAVNVFQYSAYKKKSLHFFKVSSVKFYTIFLVDFHTYG